MTRQMTVQGAATMIARARGDAGLSQRYIAQALGVSERTVKNWEVGSSLPNILQLIGWFKACGVNPVRYVLDWLNPAEFDGLSAESDIADIKSALLEYLSSVATENAIRTLSFCIFGGHGSSWNAQLEMLCAHDHTTMHSRVTVARAILENYEMEAAQGNLVATDHIAPDLDRLRAAVESGKDAAQEGKAGYVHAGEV